MKEDGALPRLDERVRGQWEGIPPTEAPRCPELAASCIRVAKAAIKRLP
jgi:hypothetical protein